MGKSINALMRPYSAYVIRQCAHFIDSNNFETVCNRVGDLRFYCLLCIFYCRDFIARNKFVASSSFQRVCIKGQDINFCNSCTVCSRPRITATIIPWPAISADPILLPCRPAMWSPALGGPSSVVLLDRAPLNTRCCCVGIRK